MSGPHRKLRVKNRGDLHTQIVFSPFKRRKRIETEHPLIIICDEEKIAGEFKVTAYFGTSDENGFRNNEPARYFTLKKNEYHFLKNDTHFDTYEIYETNSKDIIGLNLRISGSIKQKDLKKTAEQVWLNDRQKKLKKTKEKVS